MRGILWSLFLILFLVPQSHAGTERSCRVSHKKEVRVSLLRAKPLDGAPISAADIRLIQKLAKTRGAGLTYYKNGGRVEKPIEFWVYLHLELLINGGGIGQLMATRWSEVKKMNWSFAGVPPKLRAEWQRAAQVKINNFTIMDSAFPDSQRATLVAVLARMGAGEKVAKGDIRKIATVTAEAMGRLQLRGAYPPKILQFAKQLVRRELGLSYLPLTDLIATRNKQTVTFKIISIDPLAGDSGLSFGILEFHIRDVKTVQIPDAEKRAGTKLVAGEKVAWQVGDRSYVGKMSVKLGPALETIAPPRERLDFASMWADKSLVGLIVPGANMGEFGNYVLNEYKAYYEDRGYRFERPLPVADFKAFLQEGIESGHIDYFLKEAHAEGSDSNLTTVINRGSIETGTRVLDDGKREQVHLFYADLSQRHKKRIGFSDMAEWMSARRKAPKDPELFYVDTSCFGLRSARPLVNAVSSSRLVVSGTPNMADTFTNAVETPLMHLLDGVRVGQTFPEIQSTMTAHRKGSGNTYRFPGEAEWKDEIYDTATRAADIRTEMFDEKGRPITVEDFERPD